MSPAVFQPDEDGTGTIPITFFEAREDPWGLTRSEPGPGIAGLDRVLAEKGPRHKSNGKIVGLGFLGVHLPPRTARQVGEVSCACCKKGRKRRRRKNFLLSAGLFGWLSLIEEEKNSTVN